MLGNVWSLQKEKTMEMLKMKIYYKQTLRMLWNMRRPQSYISKRMAG
jgi:hypothetical protein